MEGTRITYILIKAPNLREGKLLSIYNFDPGRNRHAVCLPRLDSKSALVVVCRGLHDHARSLFNLVPSRL
jgi:hypothetical protein